MTAYQKLLARLPEQSCTWLLTGVAGFIGSNVLETLLRLDQRVVALDNFATGRRENLDQVRGLVTPGQWSRFHFIEGDIRSLNACRNAMRPSTSSAAVDFVVHQAGLGSVPRSIEDPIATNASNIDGSLNMLVAARDAGVARFVYAASSSTYGDHPGLPRVEDRIGRPLSPYAVSKYVNELYADVFSRTYGLPTVGLRYFNIFGKRQNPDGAYAAVIPRWIRAMLKGEPVYINGDGETSRDFCYVDNAVQANLLAATAQAPEALNEVYNVAVGDRTSLNELYEHLRSELLSVRPYLGSAAPVYRDFRTGDVRHSLADISKASRLLGYAPTHRIGDGLKEAMAWYVDNLDANHG